MDYRQSYKNNTILFAIISMIYGMFFVIANYKNSYSVMKLPLNVVVIVAIVIFYKMLNIHIKRSTYLYLGLSFLMSLTSFTSMSIFINLFIGVAIFILDIAVMYNQQYDTKKWGVIKYGEAGCITFAYAIVNSVSFIGDIIWKCRSKDTVKKPMNYTFLYVLLGLVIGSPIVAIVLGLLISADAVFANVFKGLLNIDWISIDIVGIGFWFVAATFILYAFLATSSMGNIDSKVYDMKKCEPVVAITFTSILAVIYVMFSGIQLFCLFIQGGAVLPKELTYAEYARQGFFQLLFAAIINYIIVYACVTLFKNNIALKIILTIISVSTYVLIASSVYRMLLYISEYHMTFLRVFVLWFLAVLVILTTATIISIYVEQFNLFKFSVATLVIMYMGFVLFKPDAFIARYNITHDDIYSYEDVLYLTENLSYDAAPYIANIDTSRIELGENLGYVSDMGDYEEVSKLSKEMVDRMLIAYFQNIVDYEKPNIRNLNISRYKAYQAAENYLK